MGENTKPSSKENSSKCGEKRKIKLRNNRSKSIKTIIYLEKRGINGRKTSGTKLHIGVDICGLISCY